MNRLTDRNPKRRKNNEEDAIGIGTNGKYGSDSAELVLSEILQLCTNEITPRVNERDRLT